MKNLVLITSVIDTPNKPLSYSSLRSFFSKEERFEQTKKTIETVKKYIPDSKILLVECSHMNDEETEYFNNNCDYFLNLWNKTELHPAIFGLSKSWGEGTMTIQALEYIFLNDLNFENFFKISGRYHLNDDFNYDIYNNDKYIFKKINDDINNITTVLYKIPFNKIKELHSFLISQTDDMIKCIGYEVLFGNYIKTIDLNNIFFVDKIGIQGYLAVSTSLENIFYT